MDAVTKLSAKGRQVTIAGIFDANVELTRRTAAEYHAPGYESLDSFFSASFDFIVVALPHDIAVPIALRALEKADTVLIEKPMGRDLKEAGQLIQAGGSRLKVGFNYRFYGGVRQAIKDARSGRFGELVAVEFLLGHGCFPGQEKTWKLNEERAGGGCLIDPGIHLLDLGLLLSPGGLEFAGGTSWSGFWKTGVEEDVNLVLRASTFSIAMHISVVHWRSAFRLAIHGTDAYGVVTGRNRSYGPQSYVVAPRWGWRSAPSQAASEKVELESNGMDVFVDEMEALLFPASDEMESWPAPSTSSEAMRVMQLLDNIRHGLGLRREF
jgi:predicted dehydrogenase